MSAPATSPNQESEQVKQKRAKGAFPRLPLSQALELPRVIYHLGEGEPVRRLTFFDHLGKKPDSGPSRMLVTTSSAYGLTVGGYQAEYLEITDRGRRIVASGNERDKYEAIYDALFSNSIVSAFVARFNQRSMPNDEIAIDYLKQTHSLSEVDAKAFLVIFKDNASHYGLIQEYSGRPLLVTREMALESIGEVSPPNGHTGSVDTSDVSYQQPNPNLQQISNGIPLPSGRMEPQFHFNIQIHLPENASPEVYDTIFKSIATHLLGYGRE